MKKDIQAARATALPGALGAVLDLVSGVLAELGEQVAIYLRPQRWLSADLGPG